MGFIRRVDLQSAIGAKGEELLGKRKHEGGQAESYREC
jgi:hypothetical protein